jgi:hypothetical protein
MEPVRRNEWAEVEPGAGSDVGDGHLVGAVRPKWRRVAGLRCPAGGQVDVVELRGLVQDVPGGGQ